MESHVLENYWKFPDWRNRSHRTSLAFSADCTMLARLIADKIVVWDTSTKSLRQVDSAPGGGGVFSLAFSEDGDRSLLETNMGSFKIQSGGDKNSSIPPPLSSFSAAPDQLYMHENEWIRYDKHAIWLPLEYRPI